MTDITTIHDPRPAFAVTVGQLTATIVAVQPDQLDQPTSCRGWQVRDLLAHLVGVADRVTRVGRGSVEEGEIQPPDVDDDSWASAWAVAIEGAQTQWSDDALLGTIVSPPFGQMPGAAALSVYTTEFTVHHWDLATSLGVDVTWNDEIVSAALAGTMAALPADGRIDGFPFDDVVPVSADAPSIDRLVAYLGRRP